MLSNIEMTFLQILADSPKRWEDVDEHASTWDYLADEMTLAWGALVRSGYIRRGWWSTKWRLTARGKRVLLRELYA